MIHLKKIQLNVKGMHCKSCVVLIKDILEDEKGVEKATASLENNTVNVNFDESLTDKTKISRLLVDEGYKIK